MSVAQWMLRLSLAGALLLSGCANFSGIATQSTMMVPHTLNDTRQPDTTVFPQQYWWKKFSDSRLDALISQAIAKNHSLKVVQSRIAGAQALEEATDSARYPQVSAGVQSTREHLSANGYFPPPLGGSQITMSSASISGQWQIDWFGKQRAALNAAIGQTRAAQADMQAAQVVLAASVASQYFTLARLQEQQQIRQALLQQSEHNARLINQRVAAGLDTTLVQRQTQAQTPQIRRDLAALTEQVAISRHALAVLIGAEPGETDQLAARLPSDMLADVPEQLPAELLGHRADVAAARWRVESELQSVREARAAFYPNLNLTAFAGFEAIGLSQWFRTDSRTMGVGPAISLPIFNAGQLRAQLKGRTVQVDAAIETYNATVLNALREVADKLASRQALQTQLQEQKSVMMQLDAACELAKARYQSGLTNYLTVLGAENAQLLQQSILIDLQARAFDVDVGLMLALGGGYVSSAIPVSKSLAKESSQNE